MRTKLKNYGYYLEIKNGCTFFYRVLSGLMAAGKVQKPIHLLGKKLEDFSKIQLQSMGPHAHESWRVPSHIALPATLGVSNSK